MQLNIDLSQTNPVQNESMFATVPLPSAHLVVITEDEMKKSTDQNTGFEKGVNLVFHCEILNSSCGNEYTGQKLPLYIAREGQETAINIGLRKLSTLAHTLGIGNNVRRSEDLHGQAFIVVLDKDTKNNSGFPVWKKILRSDGMEIADASGNFKECNFKEIALQAELHKLLELNNGGQPQAGQAPVPPAGYVPQAGQAPVPPAGYVPQAGQAPVPPAPTGGFGTPNQGMPSQPQWQGTVNQSNGQ